MMQDHVSKAWVKVTELFDGQQLFNTKSPLCRDDFE